MLPDWAGYTLIGIVAVGAVGMLTLHLTLAVRKWLRRKRG